ncbi:hypothetical protein EDC04DRAFT_2684193 [Pisolithus marmoratus]|nr:hypothetical protein EDC04DRAFT_2684193 [Pisolithus marmoratus]
MIYHSHSCIVSHLSQLHNFMLSLPFNLTACVCPVMLFRHSFSLLPSLRIYFLTITAHYFVLTASIHPLFVELWRDFLYQLALTTPEQ